MMFLLGLFVGIFVAACLVQLLEDYSGENDDSDFT